MPASNELAVAEKVYVRSFEILGCLGVSGSRAYSDLSAKACLGEHFLFNLTVRD